MLRDGSWLIRSSQLGTQSSAIARHRLSHKSNASHALFGRYSAAAEPAEVAHVETEFVPSQPPPTTQSYYRTQRTPRKSSPPLQTSRIPQFGAPPNIHRDPITSPINRNDPNSTFFEVSSIESKVPRFRIPECAEPPIISEDPVKSSVDLNDPNPESFEVPFTGSSSPATQSSPSNMVHDKQSEDLPLVSPETSLTPDQGKQRSTPPFWQQSLFRAARNRQYDQVLRMVEQVSGQGNDQFPPIAAHITTPIINVYLDALGHLGRIRDIEDAVSHFKSFPDQAPNQETCALLLRTHIESLNLRKARLLVCEMISLGISLDSNIVKIILQGEGRWAVSLETIDALLTLLTAESREMEIYNVIITAYLRRGRPDKARIAIDKTLKFGLSPDANTFYALMEYQATREGSRGVFVILNSMEKAGIAAAPKHLNLLITTLAREEQLPLTSATVIFRSHHLKPDKATCNIILRAMLRKSTSAQIESHFNEMRRLGLSPDAYTYTILLNQYKYKSVVWQRIQKMLHHQFSLNSSCINQVTRNVVLHRAISTFNRSPNRQNPSAESLPLETDLQWDPHTLTTLVAAYLRSKEWPRIVSLHRELLKRQVKLDRYFYRVMVKALLDGKRYREAAEAMSLFCDSDDILDQIFGRECHVRIAHAFFRNARNGQVRVIQAVDRLLKFSDEKGIIITEKLCNLIAIAFHDIRLDHLAIQLLESRYHRLGRFQDLEQVTGLGMSAWVILMRAYSRMGAEGVNGLRSCIERALTDEATIPTRTFLNFLKHIGTNPVLRSTHATDCDFFLVTRLKYLENLTASPRQNRRSYLTKAGISRWMSKGNSV